MTVDQERFDRAIGMFDALNRVDPNLEVFSRVTYPKALLYAQRMSAMLNQYAPNASEVLQLAARCQHIERWKIERNSYAMTKAGYNQWRRDLRDLHAQVAANILGELGYDQEAINRVCSLLKKENMRADYEAQTLEDVVVMVFITYYLEDFMQTHKHYALEKHVDILRKSLRKMSIKGIHAVLTMTDIPPALATLIKQTCDDEIGKLSIGA